MPRMKVKGLDDFSMWLQLAGTKAIPIAKAAMYDGAAVLVSALKAEIRSLPEQPGYMPDGERRQVVKRTEKAALLDGLGISRMKVDEKGTASVSIGFSGVSPLTTRKYPRGVPLNVIAKGIVTGGKVRVYGYDFVYKAAKRAEEQAKAAMQRTAAESLNNLINQSR